MHRLTIQYETPLDPEAFDRQYAEQHVPLCRAIPGVVAFTLSHPRTMGPGSTPYLVAQFDWPDEESFTAALASPEMAAAGADAESLPARRMMFAGVVEDHTA